MQARTVFGYRRKQVLTPTKLEPVSTHGRHLHPMGIQHRVIPALGGERETRPVERHLVVVLTPYACQRSINQAKVDTIARSDGHVPLMTQGTKTTEDTENGTGPALCVNEAGRTALLLTVAEFYSRVSSPGRRAQEIDLAFLLKPTHQSASCIEEVDSRIRLGRAPQQHLGLDHPVAMYLNRVVMRFKDDTPF